MYIWQIFIGGAWDRAEKMRQKIWTPNKTKVATNRETRKAIDHEKKSGSSFIIDKKENLGVHFGVERKCVEKCVID